MIIANTFPRHDRVKITKLVYIGADSAIVNNAKSQYNLTFGKEYNIMEEIDTHGSAWFWINDDTNLGWGQPISKMLVDIHFKPLCEIRDDKLKTLLIGSDDVETPIK